MGYLFENAEKMDIQAERRKTEEQRKKTEEEKKKTEEERKKAEEERKKAEEALWKLEEAERKATDAQKKLEQEKELSIKAMVECAQELGANKSQTVKKVVEKFNLTQQEAKKSVKVYWKE